jgi:hypothetical protein
MMARLRKFLKVNDIKEAFVGAVQASGCETTVGGYSRCAARGAEPPLSGDGWGTGGGARIFGAAVQPLKPPRQLLPCAVPPASLAHHLPAPAAA